MRKPVLIVVLALFAALAAACGGQAATPPPAPTAAPAAKPASPTEAPKAAVPTAAPATAAAPAAATAAPTAAPAAAATTAPTAAAAAPTTAAAAPAVKAPANNVVRINIGSYPDNLDPQQMSFVNEIGFEALLYESLVSLDSNLTAQPGAAEKWDISPDGLTWTFHLRPGLKYSDGKPVTAKNFEYAFKRAADPVLAGQYQSSTFDIAGAEEYGSADPSKTSKEDLAKLRDAMAVKAIDDNTLEIKLTHKAGYFPYIAYLWIGAPVREDMVAKGEDWYTKAENHVGNGPFMLKELKEKEIARFVPNPNWRGAKPALDELDYRFITDSKVSFEAYKNGELDIIPLGAEDLATVTKDATLSKELLRYAGSCSQGFSVNQTKKPFDNRDVRLAFAKSIDRDAWVKDVLQGIGQVSTQWIPNGYPGANPSSGAVQKFDPAAAKASLAKAGYPDGKGLPEIKLTYSSSPRNKTRNEFLAAQWQKNLGVTVVLDPVEPTTLTAMSKDVSTSPAISILGWCADYPDPQNWLTTYWRSTAFAKRYGYSNPDNDKLMDAADQETDQAKRIPMYQQAEKTVLDTDAAYIPLWLTENVFLVKPYVQTGKPTPQDATFPGFFESTKMAIKR